MKIWDLEFKVENLNNMSENTMGSLIGIEFTAITDDSLEAIMPVDHRTKQPFGLLHGGATATLAETLGSVGSQLCIGENGIAVGTQLNIAHLSSARDGVVKGICTPIKLGRSTHLWQIDIFSGDKQISSAQLTTFIKQK